MEIEKSVLNEELRRDAIREIQKEKPHLPPFEFIKHVGARFIEKQLDAFPYLCEITQVQNKLKWDELKETSAKGKYTESYGWSESHQFKFDYEIPQELYLFMVNLVYADFWSEDNERTWRKFMKRVCNGSDPMETLMWAKSIYGNNTQKEVVTT